MVYFSSFWLKHYQKLRNCCMTEPLMVYPFVNERDKKVPPDLNNKLIRDLIDIGWMSDKGLKWFGWDVNGWYAWTDANGMIYRIRDLKRNEDGKRFEKEVKKIIRSDEPRNDIRASANELYQHEFNLCVDCQLCPDRSGVSDSDDDNNTSTDGGGGEKEEEINVTAPPWQSFAGGGITDYAAIHGGNGTGYDGGSPNYGGYGDSYTDYTPPTAIPTQTVYTGDVTDTSTATGDGNPPAIKGGGKTTAAPNITKSPAAPPPKHGSNFGKEIKIQEVAKIDKLRVKPNIPPQNDKITFPTPSNPINAADWFKQPDQKMKTKNITDSEIDPGYYEASVNSRMIGFVKRHPIAAASIGLPDRGSTNISTNAVRFSTRIGLLENSDNEGSQVNAFRHALWQATITNEFGQSIAKQIGNAHEKNPLSVNGSKFETSFDTLADADETIDLLNNIIGRNIGSENTSTDMQKIALKTLDYFYQHGLWTATPTTDSKGKVIKYTISKNRLNYDQYTEAKRIIQRLNKNGFTEQEQITRDKDAQAKIDRLNRGPKI